MKNKNIWTLVLIIIILGGVWYSFDKKSEVNNNEVIKIGSILPLTGDLGVLGEEVHRGAILAVEDLKKEGINVNYISEDDAFDPKRSVLATSKLINVDKVDAVFTAVVEEAKPVFSLFNNAKIPLLSVWDSNNDLKKAGPYIFSIGFSTEKDGEVMGNYAYKNLNLRKVAIIGAIDPAMDILIDNFTKSFESLGGKIVFKERIQPDSMDNKTTITKLKNIVSDGLYMGLIPPQHGPFLKQLRQSGYKSQVMGVDSLLQSEIDSAGTFAEGIYYTNIYADKSAEISKVYKEKFNTDPTDSSLVSFGYDGMKVLVEASKIAKDKNISLHDALMTVNISGIGGPVNMNGSNFSERVEKIYHVVNGKSVEVK